MKGCLARWIGACYASTSALWRALAKLLAMGREVANNTRGCFTCFLSSISLWIDPEKMALSGSTPRARHPWPVAQCPCLSTVQRAVYPRKPSKTNVTGALAV